MSPYSLSGTAYHSYEHGDGRYPRAGRYPGDDYYAGGRYADRDQYLNVGRCSENRGYRDDSRYADNLWHQEDEHSADNRRCGDGRPYPDGCGQPQQQTRQKPRRTERRNRSKERPAQVYVECSFSSSDDESDLEVKKPTRKKKVAPLEKLTIEDEIKARAEELYEKKIAEYKRQADEKEKAEQTYEINLKKALDDQAAAIKKDEEDKKNATEAELAREQQRRRDAEEEVRRNLAAKREADQKVEAERMRALQEKAEADKQEEARRKSEIAQAAQRMFAAHVKKQADDQEAADKAQRDKMVAENTEKILMLTKKWLAAYESQKESKASSRNAASKKTSREKSIPKRIATPEETGIHDESEDTRAQLKELLGMGSKDDNLLHEGAFLRKKGGFEGDIETEYVRREVPNSTRGSKDAVIQRKEAKEPKDGKRNRKSTIGAKGEEGHRVYKDGQSMKGTSGSRKPAMYAVRWFAGSSYM